MSIPQENSQLTSTHHPTHIMGSHPIQVTITNMVNLVHDQLDNINQLFWQGDTHQANLLLTMVTYQLKYIQDLQVKLSDATPAPRRYSGS